MGWYAALARRLGDQRWFRPIATEVVPVVDRALAQLGWRSTPWPTLLLITTGRASGRERSTPLYFVEHGQATAVVATNYGRAEPDWSRNLRAEPRCLVKLHRNVTAHRARMATAAEWDRLFARFAAFYPPYRRYLEQAHRDVPIWVLEPVPGDRGVRRNTGGGPSR